VNAPDTFGNGTAIAAWLAVADASLCSNLRPHMKKVPRWLMTVRV
jgi:hypothetical protein